MASQVLGNERVKQKFADIVLDMVYDRFKGKQTVDPKGSEPPSAS